MDGKEHGRRNGTGDGILCVSFFGKQELFSHGDNQKRRNWGLGHRRRQWMSDVFTCSLENHEGDRSKVSKDWKAIGGERQGCQERCGKSP